ncbi:hypothetical protein D4764_22G0000190 [Takifugu flavidus]|uniref:Uncharacterized protein n=1 Tax=Takifugu flavidus TaxID=433684 RepID=A0A5C6NA54_9TELE|nr:hypothetical protein D4764_22G0000190 [Takifugu flavidus]
MLRLDSPAVLVHICVAAADGVSLDQWGGQGGGQEVRLQQVLWSPRELPRQTNPENSLISRAPAVAHTLVTCQQLASPVMTSPRQQHVTPAEPDRTAQAGPASSGTCATIGTLQRYRGPTHLVTNQLTCHVTLLLQHSTVTPQASLASELPEADDEEHDEEVMKLLRELSSRLVAWQPGPLTHMKRTQDPPQETWMTSRLPEKLVSSSGDLDDLQAPREAGLLLRRPG